MKVITRRILILVWVLFAVSCSKQADEKENGHSHQSETLYLNHGSKWQVNDEMKPFVSASEELLSGYSQTKEADYHRLAEGLKGNNKDLISSCTMDGEPHEVLHEWLHPHLALVEELSKAENEQSAEDIIGKIKKSFERYHTYFD